MVDPREAFAAARRLHMALTVILALTLVFVVAAAIVGASDEISILTAVTGLASWDGTPLGQGQERALAAIGLVHLGFWVALLLVARAFVGHFSEGNVARASERAKTLAYILWALFVWTIAAGALGSVAVTWHLPEGERALAIGVGTAQISLGVAALIAGFIARAFALYADLWQDHREVI